MPHGHGCQTITAMTLKSLLVDLGRSLLQYAAECWPWAGSEHDTRLIALAERQQQSIGSLVRLIASRTNEIDFGTYPTEYTDLHYLTTETLVERLIGNQKSLISAIQDARTSLNGDSAASELVSQISANETGILEELESMQG